VLDDARLRRLAEMEIDVYVPRARGAEGGAAVAASAPDPHPEPKRAGGGGRPRMVLLARCESEGAKTLLAQVARALALARIDAVIPDAVDAGALEGAAGVIVFGEALAREAGAALPVGRQKALQWVAAAEPSSMRGSVAAKRALWGEIRRAIRGLNAPTG
jgi:hypothetical protein